MNPSTTIQLGNVTLTWLEIPDSIGAGGAQALTTHRLVGGVRVMGAMGRDDQPLAGSGRCYGKNARQRCQQLDYMRVSGSQQTLTWGGFSYLVAVKEFTYEYHYQYDIPYKIICEVVSDQTKPITTNSQPTIDDAINADLDSVQTLSSSVNNPALTASVASITSSVAAVPTFAYAS